MAVGLLAKLARRARVPVFVLKGDGGAARARRLRLDPRLRVVSSPRHATLLLVAGPLPKQLVKVAKRVHDQLPEPRGTLVWGAGVTKRRFPGSVPVGADDDVARALVEHHRALLSGDAASGRAFGPEKNPTEWQGVGPHGQGGKGMMGGKPYGRPMAMTDDDLRDGLQLDAFSVTIGPFLPWLPPGLQLELSFQGDVVQSLRPQPAALEQRDVPEVFVRAEREAVSVAELELARAGHHLEATADLLLVLGLDALAERALRIAGELSAGDTGVTKRFSRMLERTGALLLATRGVGQTDAREVTGPVARAAGHERDARCDDPAYDGLDFQPITHSAGDAEARWRQRLAEAVQALELAGRAGDRRRQPGLPLEGPRGTGGDWGALLQEVARGQAWDALVTTLVSLDLEGAQLKPHEGTAESTRGN